MRTGTALVICLGLIGCTGGEPIKSAEPLKIDQTYSATQRAVWQGLVQVVAEKGFSIQSSDFNSGILSTNQTIVKGDAKKGGFNNQPKYSLGLNVFGSQSTKVERASVTAIMNGSAGAVRIRIKVVLQASAGSGIHLSWKPVNSNGKLEAEIFRGISDMVGNK